MFKLRFKIVSMLIGVAFVAVGFTALKQANDAWDSIVFSVTFTFVGTSVLLAIYRTDQNKAFWIGFVLFGSSYLAFSLIPSVRPRLITHKILVFADQLLPSDFVEIESQTLNNDGSWSPTPMGPPTHIRFNSEQFIRIGHSLFAWIVALVGGEFSRAIYVRSRNRKSIEPVQATAPDTAHSHIVGEETS